MAALRGRLVPVVEELSRTCQGRVVTELEAEDFLDLLRDAFVGRIMTEMEPWGEDESLREPVVDLVTRHLLAEVREEFVERRLVSKRN